MGDSLFRHQKSGSNHFLRERDEGGGGESGDRTRGGGMREEDRGKGGEWEGINFNLQHTHTRTQQIFLMLLSSRSEYVPPGTTGERRSRGRKVTRHYPASRTTTLDRLQKELYTDTPIKIVSTVLCNIQILFK